MNQAQTPAAVPTTRRQLPPRQPSLSFCSLPQKITTPCHLRFVSSENRLKYSLPWPRTSRPAGGGAVKRTLFLSAAWDFDASIVDIFPTHNGREGPLCIRTRWRLFIKPQGTSSATISRPVLTYRQVSSVTSAL